MVENLARESLAEFRHPYAIGVRSEFVLSSFNGHYVGAFDPMDIIMYAIGVGLAVLVEQKIFANVLNFCKNGAPHIT